jgi:hypothetical protein
MHVALSADDTVRTTVVRTQRMQTEKNKKFMGDIQRLDNDIDDLMKLAKKPGPQGPAGPKGDNGPPGTHMF